MILSYDSDIVASQQRYCDFVAVAEDYKKINAQNRRVYFLSLNILKMQQNLHNLQDEEFEILRFFGAE